MQNALEPFVGSKASGSQRLGGRVRSEIQRPVHRRDENREKEDDEADPGGHPSEFVHLM